MNRNTNTKSGRRAFQRDWRGLAARLSLAVLLVFLFAEPATASTWNPSGAIRGDGNLTLNDDQTAADVTLTFADSDANETFNWNNTAQRFDLSDDLFVSGTLSGNVLRATTADIQGTLTASGAVRFDANLTLNDDQTAADAVLTFGSDGTNETVTFANTNDRFEFSDDVRATGTITTESTLSGAILRVSGPADIHGALTASGAVRTDENLTLNDDQTAADVTLTFADSDANETITWNNTTQRFEFSDDIVSSATLSGTSLTLSGLKSCNTIDTNANGLLACGTDGGAAGSGQFVLIPEYPHTLYFQSGATNFVGQLYTDIDTGSYINYYRWTTSKTSNQNYWLSTRVRIPTNFNAWESQPIQIQYRSSGGRLDVFFRDTADAVVSLTGNTGLVSHDSWTTANITGPESAGTYTKDDYITLFVRLTASGGTGLGATADLGFIELNWDTQ